MLIKFRIYQPCLSFFFTFPFFTKSVSLSSPSVVLVLFHHPLSLHYLPQLPHSNLMKCTIIHYSYYIVHAPCTELKMFVHCILSFTIRTCNVLTKYHRLPTSVGLVQACPNHNTLSVTIVWVFCLYNAC